MKLVTLRICSFTLMEIIVVVALIALASGAIGIYTVKAIRSENFSASVRRVVDRFQLAQDLMLASSSDGEWLDTHIAFSKEKEGYVCSIKFTGQTEKRELQIFNQEILLKEVDVLEWELDGKSEPVVDELTLQFSKLEGRVPKGTLSLISRDGKIRHISCRGYPIKYRSVSKVTGHYYDTSEQEMSEALYPLELQGAL